MALATTCPQCRTSFKVVPDQLKLRRGLVRCGVCQHVFSGVDHLRYVDEPAARARPAAPATPSGSEGDSGDLNTAFFLPDTVFGSPPAQEGSPGEPVAGPAGTAQDPESPRPWERSPEAEAGAATAGGASDESFAPLRSEPGGRISLGGAADGGRAAEAAPMPGSEALPERFPASLPDALPDRIPASVPDTLPDRFPASLPEALRDDVAGHPPERLPASEVPAAVPEHLPDESPAAAPERRPEASSETAAGAFPESAAATGAVGEGQADNEPDKRTRAASPALASPDVTERPSFAAQAQADEESAIDFFAQRRPRVGFTDRHRLLAWLFAGLLALALAVQAAIHFRSTISAALPPAARPPIAAMLAPLGLRIGLPRSLADLTIESFELQAGAEPGVLTMSALLRNRARWPVEWPSLELTLTDAANQVLVRKVLSPADYLDDDAEAGRGIAAQSERALRLALEARDVQPSGYTVVIFYP